MLTYSDPDIQFGQGAFEQAMRNQTAIGGRVPRITPGVAVGILSAAMRGGLPAKHFDQLIDGSFTDSSIQLKRMLSMYEGDDWDISLWHLQPTGFYKLATALCRPRQAQWRYEPRSMTDDF